MQDLGSLLIPVDLRHFNYVLHLADSTGRQVKLFYISHEQMRREWLETVGQVRYSYCPQLTSKRQLAPEDCRVLIP